MLVAAVARDGAIGRDGGIPWHLPGDINHFRELTMGKPVVMGRRTWDSIPERFRPLQGRRNVIVTRSASLNAHGAEHVGSLKEALELLATEPLVCVVGGAQLYAQALPQADVLELTEIALDVKGDTFFPAFDRSIFVEVAREAHVSADGIEYAFTRYERS